MKVTIEIPDDHAAILEKQHGDITAWLTEITESQFVTANRIIAKAAMQQLIEQGRDMKFTATVADLALANPLFKSPLPNLAKAEAVVDEVAKP